MGVWTPERTEALTKFHRQGLTYGEMSKRMKLTRNQVIGKSWRLGLKKYGWGSDARRGASLSIYPGRS